MHVLATVAALVIPAASLLAMPPIFTKLSFEEAKKQAAKEGKLLVVDSMADWCPPCKQMDKTTWVDPKTVEWFKENAIAFQFDVDKDEKLAKDLAIEAMPTMIVFKDGKEIDRDVGFQTTAQLIGWLEDVKKGKTKAAALEEETKKLREKAGDRVGKNGKVDIKERLDIARKLSRSEPKLAADEYAWLWDNMLDHDQAFYGVRLSFMVNDMQQLASRHEIARERFSIVRDDAEKQLKAGTGTDRTLTDWIMLNKVLNDDERTLKWYDRVKSDPEATRDFKRNERELRRIFTERKRWADLGNMYKNPEADANSEVTRARYMMNAMPKGEHSEQMKKYTLDSTRENLAVMYASLLAAGRDADAAKVAAALVEFSDTPESRRELVHTAAKANQLRREQLKLLDEADSKSPPTEADKALRMQVTDAIGVVGPREKK